MNEADETIKIDLGDLGVQECDVFFTYYKAEKPSTDCEGCDESFIISKITCRGVNIRPLFDRDDVIIAAIKDKAAWSWEP